MGAQPAFRVPAQAAAPTTSAPLHLLWSRLPLGFGSSALSILEGTRAARGVSGIYAIFVETPAGPTCLLVGAARDIGARLNDHAHDPRVIAHVSTGALRLAWAPVASLQLPGILAFVTDALSPRFHDSVPSARRIPVNLPG